MANDDIGRMNGLYGAISEIFVSTESLNWVTDVRTMFFIIHLDRRYFRAAYKYIKQFSCVKFNLQLSELRSGGIENVVKKSRSLVDSKYHF